MYGLTERTQAIAGAAQAHRHRAESRRDPVGRGRRPFVHARRGLDGQEPPDGECRTYLRGLGGHASSWCGSGENTTRASTFLPRRARRFRLASRAKSSVAALGQRASVANPPATGRSPQPDARQQRPRLDDVEDPRQSGSVLVQRCHQQVRRVVPAAQQRPAGLLLRPHDAGVHADRYVLRHAPPAVRQRPRRDGVFQRAERSDVRLDRHQGVRPDQGRTEGRRLVRAGARHQRRRQDHEAVEFILRAARSGSAGDTTGGGRGARGRGAAPLDPAVR